MLARRFLAGMALTGLVLLKPANFLMRAFVSRRAMLLWLRRPFRGFAGLNIGLSNLLSHIVLGGNILSLVDAGRVVFEWLFFRARLVDIRTWRLRAFRLGRPFGGASTSPASISSAPASRRPPATATS